MKSVIKSLKHKGIYVSTYEPIGFSIKIRGHTIKLTPKTEQMAVAWVRKTQSITTPPDKLFYANFIQEFLEQLILENPSLPFLQDFFSEHLNSVNTGDFDWSPTSSQANNLAIDFSSIREYLAQQKLKKLNMTKSEKKTLREQRKIRREALKEKYGYAFVNGQKVEIANWTAEPSCLFAGRGQHPRRGRWKTGPTQADIILNLSPDAPIPSGTWTAIVWEPDKMYLAKWTDKLTGKTKYVWFSDSAFIKQKREKMKFDKAKKLGTRISKIEAHITTNLTSRNDGRRKIATVCWLIFAVNMRVGDEKDPGEADTVGAITLRPEHVKIETDVLHFDFLGKDSVRWMKSIKTPQPILRNVTHYSKTCEEYLFEGLDSKKVTKFFSEKMKGLTAKVFRTWRTTTVVKEYLAKCRVTTEDPEYVKKFHAKMANLKGAKIANHKRKVSAKFDERLAKKVERLHTYELQHKEKQAQGKKTAAILKRLHKTKLDIELMRATKEYNLTTSLKSYIDPRLYVKWAAKVDFALEKFYSKALRSKFSWALKKTV